MTPPATAPLRNAITLIETIMVIALLAAAAVTSTIMFDADWIDRRAASAATNNVADTLIAARNTAITGQANVAVRRLRSGGRDYLLITEYAGPLRGSKSWVVELADDVRVQGLPREIQFQATGTADRALQWTVSQSRSRGRVAVAPASGRVSRRMP